MTRPPPKPLTAARLEKAALSYLERYAASEARLAAVLKRRIHRAQRYQTAEELAPLPAAAAAIVAKFLRAGLLDDARFAETKIAALARRGLPPRTIAQRLKTLGVAEALIEATMADAQPDRGEAEVAAALRFAERRRLGPFRTSKAKDGSQARDLAALARQGFSYDIARRIVEASSVEALRDAMEVP